MARTLSRRPRLLRLVASFVLFAEVFGLAAPALYASTDYPEGHDRDAYAAAVQERVSLRNDLEERWAQARYRRRQIETAIENIRAEEPPAGADMTGWYRERSARIRWLDGYLSKNEDALIRYQSNLGTVYNRLDGDRRFLETTEDQQLKQALGSLVGIAGVAGIPLAARPAFRALRGTPGQPPPQGRASVSRRGTIKGGGRVDTRVTASPNAPPRQGLLSRIRGRGTPTTPPNGPRASANATNGTPTNPRPTTGANGAGTSGTTATQPPARRGLLSRLRGRGATGAAAGGGAAATGEAVAARQGAGGGANATGAGGNATGTQGTAGARASGTSGVRPANPATAPETGWRTEVGKKGEILLRQGDRVIKTGDQATYKEGKGRKAAEVRNEAAFSRAEGLKQLYGTRDHLARSIRDLRADLKTAPNKQARQSIQSEIKTLQGQEKALGRDIKAAEAGAKQPSAIRGLATSAAKWALFSTALTVSMQAFDQLRENDWDVTSIDWGEATAPLQTPEFWGGTAGSFGVSMLASAVIPGGTFLKTLGAIGGAAVGWQLGSATLDETDWGELGASTLGATIGTILGSALGPVGSFLGGLAGHFLATWALGKVREWLEQESVSHSREDREIIDLDGDVTPYAGAAPPSNSGPTAPASEAAQIKERMDALYRQIESNMQRPPGTPERAQVAVLHQEYDSLFKQLESIRQSGAAVSGVGSWGS